MSFDPHNDPSPVNPVPLPVWGIVILIAAVELTLMLADRGILGGASGSSWRALAIQDYAYSDRLFEWMLQNGSWPADGIKRFLTYSFVHYNFTSAAFGVVFVLALGKFVGETLGGLQAALIFVASAALSAALYGLVINDSAPLVGAMVGSYGLIGAFSYVLMTQLESVGENQMRAFQLLGFLMGIQLLFALVFGGPPQWIADLFGALIGFVLAAIFQPGGLLARMRRD